MNRRPGIPHPGTIAEGPQGLIQSRARVDESRAKFARAATIGSDPLYGPAVANADTTIEKGEIVFMMKGRKQKGFKHGYSEVISFLNNMGADAKGYFPGDVEAQKEWISQSIVPLGIAFDRIDHNETTGGIEGTHFALSVAGTIHTIAIDPLPPGELVEARPPDPSLQGKFPGRTGKAFQNKALLDLRPFSNQTGQDMWERIWRQRYLDRLRNGMQGRADPRELNGKKYMELKGPYKTAKTFENAALTSSLMFVYSLIQDGVINIPTMTGGYDFRKSAAKALTAETFVEGLALNLGLVEERGTTDVKMKKDISGTGVFLKPKSMALTRMFFCDAVDKERFQFKGATSMQIRQRKANKETAVSFFELNSHFKSKIFGKVIKPADRGKGATIYKSH